MTRTIQVFGNFDQHQELERAIDELKSHNFASEKISVLLPNRTVPEAEAAESAEMTKAPEGAVAGAGTGLVLGGTLGWLAGIGALAIPGLGPFVAAGPIAALLAGASAGGAVGGLTGALLGLGIPEHEVAGYEQRTMEGSTLISISCANESERDTATSILERNGGKNVSSVTRGEEMGMPVPGLASQIQVSNEAIEKRAYEIWEREGRPEGKSAEFWSQAERELKH